MARTRLGRCRNLHLTISSSSIFSAPCRCLSHFCRRRYSLQQTSHELLSVLASSGSLYATKLIRGAMDIGDAILKEDFHTCIVTTNKQSRTRSHDKLAGTPRVAFYQGNVCLPHKPADTIFAPSVPEGRASCAMSANGSVRICGNVSAAVTPKKAQGQFLWHSVLYLTIFLCSAINASRKERALCESFSFINIRLKLCQSVRNNVLAPPR